MSEISQFHAANLQASKAKALLKAVMVERLTSAKQCAIALNDLDTARVIESQLCEITGHNTESTRDKWVTTQRNFHDKFGNAPQA